MLKVQIHITCPDGEPISGSGDSISGKSSLEIIDAMKNLSPFTAEMSSEEYIKNVNGKISKENLSFPEISPEKTAEEFLLKLAKHGFISFLPCGEIAEKIMPCAEKPDGGSPEAETENNTEAK
jgi:hypothetical protein